MAIDPESLNPGSYDEYKLATGEHDALGRHSVALWAYKLALAEARGETLEDLHEGPFSYSEQDVA